MSVMRPPKVSVASAAVMAALTEAMRRCSRATASGTEVTMRTRSGLSATSCSASAAGNPAAMTSTSSDQLLQASSDAR
jgi:hypothetical protein